MEREQTRRDLKARPDVADEDIDDVLEIALKRQQEDRRVAPGATTEQVEAVARELDIDPKYVEGAIGELRRTREEAAAAAARAAEASARAKKRVGMALVGVLGLALGGLGLTAGAAWMGAGAVDAAATAAHGAQARVEVVLERQAALAPQLVALAGGESAGLVELAGKVRAAETVDARIEAASTLSTEMATAIARLPPPGNDADSTLRLQLYDEIAGGQNRITTEQRRYEEAEAAWRDAASGGLGGLAVSFGFAEAPP